MDSLQFAKYILSYMLHRYAPISNVQLQCIMYLVNRQYYAKTKQWILDEHFVAYPLYPVCESVYDTYKGYGPSKIYDGNNDGLPKSANEQLLQQLLEEFVGISLSSLFMQVQKSTAWKNNPRYSRIPLEAIEMEAIGA